MKHIITAKWYANAVPGAVTHYEATCTCGFRFTADGWYDYRALRNNHLGISEQGKVETAEPRGPLRGSA